jgi:hypothetical protein
MEQIQSAKFSTIRNIWNSQVFSKIHHVALEPTFLSVNQLNGFLDYLGYVCFDVKRLLKNNSFSKKYFLKN